MTDGVLRTSERDAPTVDGSGRRLDLTIVGVEHVRLGPAQVDHRGSLLKVIDARAPFWHEPIVYAYRFTILPARINGWGMHELQTDRYLVPAGRMRVVLYDGRETSETYGQINQVHFADEAPRPTEHPARRLACGSEHGRDRGRGRQLPDEGVRLPGSGQAPTRSPRGRDSFDFTLRDG
jgi:hypothetical protein